MEQKTLKSHSLRFENGKIYVSGVTNMEQFDDKEIILRLMDETLILKGNGFNVEDMNVNSGQCVISGKPSDVSYRAKAEKLSVIKRLFK